MTFTGVTLFSKTPTHTSVPYQLETYDEVSMCPVWHANTLFGYLSFNPLLSLNNSILNGQTSLE